MRSPVSSGSTVAGIYSRGRQSVLGARQSKQATAGDGTSYVSVLEWGATGHRQQRRDGTRSASDTCASARGRLANDGKGTSVSAAARLLLLQQLPPGPGLVGEVGGGGMANWQCRCRLPARRSGEGAVSLGAPPPGHQLGHLRRGLYWLWIWWRIRWSG